MTSIATVAELARKLGRSKQVIHVLVKNGAIPRNSDGTFDEAVARAAYLRNVEPKRQQPLIAPDPDVAAAMERLPADERPVTIEDARDALSLIRRVLAEEGRGMAGAPTFDDVRTAETILKARERAQAIAIADGEHIRRAPAFRQVEEAFAGFRKELQAFPARYGAQIAARLGCDVGDLDAELSAAIREFLATLSAPVVRSN